MKKLIVMATVMAALVAGCTDAERASMLAFGDAASVKCWSGDTVIYDGRSTGKVSNATNSDGYFFRDAKDGVLREVSGNCVVAYGDVE